MCRTAQSLVDLLRRTKIAILSINGKPIISSWWIRRGLNVTLFLLIIFTFFLTVQVLSQSRARKLRLKPRSDSGEISRHVRALLSDEVSTVANVEETGDLLDQIQLDCEVLKSGNSSEISRLKQWTYDHRRLNRAIYSTEDRCSVVKSLFNFPSEPNSQEEEEYPLAYGILVHKNFAQFMFMMSAMYQPQNVYCIAVSGSANREFQNLMESIDGCFPNFKIMFRPPIKWGAFEIINSTYSCFEYLTNLEHEWKYYQYLSGVDAPLKTNLEMVKIFKTLNETINFTITPFPKGRARRKPLSRSPLKLYKSMLSALLPRAAADFIVKANETQKLLEFLVGTVIPDESFWGTLSGNVRDFPIPGGLDVEEWRQFVDTYNKTHRITDDNRGSLSYYISRYQVWRRSCKGKLVSYSCVYGVEDYASVMKQPHLIAHKMYIDFQPATYFCALKEVRDRSINPTPVDTRFYAQLPQVELKRGVAYSNLSHPDWMLSKTSAG